MWPTMVLSHDLILRFPSRIQSKSTLRSLPSSPRSASSSSSSRECPRGQRSQGVERRLHGLDAKGQGVKQERIAVRVTQSRRGMQRIPNAQVRGTNQILVSQQIVWRQIAMLLGDSLLQLLPEFDDLQLPVGRNHDRRARSEDGEFRLV